MAYSSSNCCQSRDPITTACALVCCCCCTLQVTVSAGLHILGRALTIPLTIQNIQFHCLARVTARPLLPHYPYVGAVGVSFIEPPHVNFELPVGLLGGLDVMALPGIYGAFRLATQLAARQYAVYPK